MSVWRTQQGVSGVIYDEGTKYDDGGVLELFELGGIPIDRVARRVTGPGEHYERPLIMRLLCFDEMPPRVPLTINHETEGADITADLTGVRVGQLTVVGYFGRIHRDGSRAKAIRRAKNTARYLGKSFNPASVKRGNLAGAAHQQWICRCLCGLYTIRTAKQIKRPYHASHVMCSACLIDRYVSEGIPRSDAFRFVTYEPGRKIHDHNFARLCALDDRMNDEVRKKYGTQSANVVHGSSKIG